MLKKRNNPPSKYDAGKNVDNERYPQDMWKTSPVSVDNFAENRKNPKILCFLTKNSVENHGENCGKDVGKRWEPVENTVIIVARK